MIDVALPSTTALADVGQLAGRPLHLTPPLVWRSPPTVRRQGVAVTLRCGVAGDGPGLAPMRDVLDGDLTDRVLVIAGAVHAPGAIWGEILSVAAVARGAVGVLVDGPCRDHAAVTRTGLPVASASEATAGPDGRVHVIETGGPVALGTTTVDEGDVIVLDQDGVVSLPVALAADLLSAARDYEAAEGEVLAALRSGTSLRASYLAKGKALRTIAARFGTSSDASS